MDTMALGFKLAWKLVQDGRLDAFIQKRYESYKTGIGKRIVDGSADFLELERCALSLGEVTAKESGAQEYLEGIVNEAFFG
jgi:xylose isomerase